MKNKSDCNYNQIIYLLEIITKKGNKCSKNRIKNVLSEIAQSFFFNCEHRHHAQRQFRIYI